MRAGTSKTDKLGFTIVELLIVVVVIAILAAVTIVAYNGITQRAKDSVAQNAAAQAAKKLAVVSIQNGETFPADKNAFLAAAGLNETSGTTYQYTLGSGGTSYCLTSTANGKAFYATNTNITPVAGVCPGHAPPGGTVIVNLVGNPSLETDANGWTGSSGNLGPTRVQVSGKWVFRGVRTDTAAAALRASYTLPSAVTVGSTYTASATVYSSAARTVTIGVRQAGTTSTVFAQDYTFTAGETKRISVTGVSSQASVYVNILTATGAVGETYYVDEVMLTEGSTLYPYADGDTPGWAWDGTAGNSTSRGPAL